MPRWAELQGHSLWFYYREEHQRPHVAVRGEHRATLDLTTGALLAGHLPAKLHGHLRRFILAHHREAMQAWADTRPGRTTNAYPRRQEVKAVDLTPDVVGATLLSRYILELEFDDGEVRVIDLEPHLIGLVFQPLLHDYELFCQFRVEAEAGTIVWPNGADLSPRTLHAHSRMARPPSNAAV